MGLAVLAEILAVISNDSGGVVEDARLLALVDRYDDRGVVFPRQVLHQADGWAVWNFFRGVEPAGLLLRAEVRAGEDFLEANDLGTSLRRLPDVLDMLIDHGLPNLLKRQRRRSGIRRLNQGASNDT